MKGIDFLFWHYYCFCERHKKVYFGNNVWQAIIMVFITLSMTCGMLAALFNTFVISIGFYDVLNGYDIGGGRRIIAFIIFAPTLIYFDYRYTKKKSIIEGHYQRFRDKWGDPDNNTQKNKRILLVYTIITIPVLLTAAIILGELNKRGLLDGYRLFSLVSMGNL